MKDTYTEKRVAQLHPKVKEDFINFINDAEAALGITIRITQGLRPFAEQAALYAQGRTVFVDSKGRKLGIVTNAKPGQSFHQYGLAVDLAIMVDGKVDWNFDYSKLKPFAAKYGISWGGDWKSFKDRPHFEKGLGHTWRTLLAKYNKKDFIDQYVNV